MRNAMYYTLLSASMLLVASFTGCGKSARALLIKGNMPSKTRTMTWPCVATLRP